MVIRRENKKLQFTLLCKLGNIRPIGIQSGTNARLAATRKTRFLHSTDGLMKLRAILMNIQTFFNE